jgi:hypothetical protein
MPSVWRAELFLPQGGVGGLKRDIAVTAFFIFFYTAPLDLALLLTSKPLLLVERFGISARST